MANIYNDIVTYPPALFKYVFYLGLFCILGVILIILVKLQTTFDASLSKDMQLLLLSGVFLCLTSSFIYYTFKVFDWIIHKLFHNIKVSTFSKIILIPSLLIFIFISYLVPTYSMAIVYPDSNHNSYLPLVGNIKELTQVRTPNISVDELFSLTNNEREKESLPPLKRNELLDKAAQLKAEDMASKGYWSHNAPDGTQPWVFFGRVGYTYSYAGENLAQGQYTSNEVVNRWMESEEHKKNILGTQFTEVGYAVYDKYSYFGNNRYLVVQMFGAPIQVPKIVNNQNQKVNANNTGNNIDLNEIIKYRDNIIQVKKSWEVNNDRYSREEINKLLDSFTRQVEFCNTIISNVESEKGNNTDNLSLWNAVIGMGNETAAITKKLIEQ